MSAAEFTIAPVRAFRLKQIVLPAEHGGWGFLFEPIVAATAIAFSPAAPWISLMAVGAFLSRQPLKVFIADRIGTNIPGRGNAALLFLFIFGSLFVVGLTGAYLTGGAVPLMPFLFVAPFVPFQVYADVNRKARQLLPELGGAASISASAASIALAGGNGWPVAMALWAVFICRLIPSIFYVRQRLLLEKGKAFSRTIPLVLHLAAFVLTGIMAYYRLLPYLTLLAMAVLLYRAFEGLSPWRKKLKAMKIGVREVIYGTLTVAMIILGYYAGI